LRDKGQIDLVVERKNLPKVISSLILKLTNTNKTFQSDLGIVNEQQPSPISTITQAAS